MKEVWENELGLCKITGLSCYSMFGLEGKPRNYFSQSQLEVSYADKCYDYYENGVKRGILLLKSGFFMKIKKDMMLLIVSLLKMSVLIIF
jgi:hypothetical protein